MKCVCFKVCTTRAYSESRVLKAKSIISEMRLKEVRFSGFLFYDHFQTNFISISHRFVTIAQTFGSASGDQYDLLCIIWSLLFSCYGAYLITSKWMDISHGQPHPVLFFICKHLRAVPVKQTVPGVRTPPFNSSYS